MAAAQEQPAPESVREEDRLDYTPQAGSVSLARRRTGRLVTRWGYPELAWSAALLVSGLATDALLHGCRRDRPFLVRIVLTVSVLRIEVSDPRGGRPPVLRVAEEDERFGRGLLIVARLADRWGVEPDVAGKTVFAELDLTQPRGRAVVSELGQLAAPPSPSW